jgi:phosphate/sulfate permease
MLADILLLDIFNSLGMPTSTTVSIVFDLLGAAVAIGVIKSFENGADISEVGKYINSASALNIISGILMSVVIAFTIGAIIQYFSRLLFSFQYDENKRVISIAVFGGIAIAAITYFIIFKGLKGTDFYNNPSELFGEHGIKGFLKEYTSIIILSSLAFWTFISYILVKFL